MADELISLLSNDQLQAMKEANPDNASVVAMIDKILGDRAKQEEQAQANSDFAKGIEKLVSKLAHPDNIHNVLIRWAKQEVDDTSVEAENVEVPNTDGTEGTHPEARFPKVEVEGYVVEVNHITKLGASGGTTTPTASKRAIVVYKHNPEGADDNAGEFTSASKACEKLGLTVGGDSAMRVLQREGYYTKPLS